jgi:lysophospholipase L1-like esterase
VAPRAAQGGAAEPGIGPVGVTLDARRARRRACLVLALWWVEVGCSAQPRPAETVRPLPPAAEHGSLSGEPTLAPPLPLAPADPASELRPAIPPEVGGPDAPLVVNVGIEDPSGRALDSFYAALRQTEHKKKNKQAQARIVFYGASHVASDLYTDVIRSKLQARFGDAGAGFVQPLRAVAGYRSAGVTFEQANGWTAVNVKARAPEPGRYGLAGLYLGSQPRKVSRCTFVTRAHSGLAGTADSIELWYLKQPRGGRLRVSIDGVTRVLSTSAARFDPAYQRFAVRDEPHRIELSTSGDAPVQLFGVALERSVPGVIVDTLGIPGSRARYHLLWDDEIYREHLKRRKPNLIVLAYGTNESGDDDEPIETYASDLRKVVARVREIVPEASCLLIGPSDRPIENPDGTFVDRPRTAQITETQRAVAAEYGCGFFDTVAFMGGRMAMLRWVAAMPPLGTPDYVHFTRAGYDALGQVLHQALMTGYEPMLPAPSPPTAAMH